MHDEHPYAAERGNSGSSTIGWAACQALVWGGIGFAIYLAFGAGMLALRPEQKPSAAAAPQTASTPAAAQPTAPSPSPPAVNSLVYRADRSGHVLLTASVNGAAVRFIVDTGATVVALSLRDAQAAGIGPGELHFNQAVATANGRVRAAALKLREIRLEQLSVYDVPAVIIEQLDTSLLGMSFLTRLQSYEMRDGALTITW